MSEFYKITKLRLVNFHNVGTTTLDIKSGGHLFLLGDNGSGKTTVLDAVHFVLTGGRSMEFNSAARVVGAKTSGGRNIQGVVLRYNIETNGPMNPDGGITYAALEIETRNGRPVSIGAQQWAFRLGFALLATLMIAVTLNDLSSFGLWQRLAGLIG